jgi:hypothetical protein
MLEIHFTGKTIKKRQNFDSSTPPAHAEHLHFTLNGDTRRAPAPPDTSTQTTWEDADHKVSEVARSTPTDNLGHSPLDRLTPPSEKRETE